ncbi:MAG: N-acetylmuramoyl-L-alanine amidase [Thermodesulfovibrionales bacterium]|jgi:hypothetical protein
MKTKGKFLLMTVEEMAVWLGFNRITRRITHIQNHHTWRPDYRNFTGNNHFALLEGMEHYQMTERGFSEIAQNLTTFPDGQVAVCRYFDRIPAGIKGANQFGLCIEHVGNFDVGGDLMTEEHKDGIVGLNALLCRTLKLIPSTDTIIYHHWYDLTTGKRTNGTGQTKTCPGTNFFGGNTVEAAETHFIPQIAAAMRRNNDV